MARVSLEVPGPGDGAAWLLSEGDGRIGPGSLSSDTAFAMLRHLEAAIELLASSSDAIEPSAEARPAEPDEMCRSEVGPATRVRSRLSEQSAAG